MIRLGLLERNTQPAHLRLRLKLQLLNRKNLRFQDRLILSQVCSEACSSEFHFQSPQRLQLLPERTLVLLRPAQLLALRLGLPKAR
jgi:hypothetical protein